MKEGALYLGEPDIASGTHFTKGFSDSTFQLPDGSWRNSREFYVQILSKYLYFAYIV